MKVVFNWGGSSGGFKERIGDVEKWVVGGFAGLGGEVGTTTEAASKDVKGCEVMLVASWEGWWYEFKA